MEYQLDNTHPKYIRITVSGVVEKKGLIRAMSELIGHPDYQAKHSLWDFTGGEMGLSMGDLGEIAGILKLYKTRSNSFANRSALVVPGLMDMGMARIYVSLTKFLPFDYRVFKTLEEAEVFLISDSG